MKRLFIAALLAVACVSMFSSLDASALGLKVAPLDYKATLKTGERRQGFIDISNPSTQAVSVTVSVQAFRQIDDDGGLQFYDDEQISAGIVPELRSLELDPKGAVRLFFTIDGNKLPEGDVFAAVFFTTEPTQARTGIGQLVRVGTLLSLVNKTPGDRSAVITSFDMPFIQFDDMANGTYRIKNTGRKEQGFYPTVSVSSWPAGATRQVQSSLVFGGRERQNDIAYRAGYGIRRIDVSYGESKRSRWVILVQPWVIVAALLVMLIVVVELLLLRKRRKARKHS